MNKKILFASLIIFKLSLAQKNAENKFAIFKNSDFDSLEQKFRIYRYNRDFIQSQLYANIFLEKGKKEKDTLNIIKGYYMMANSSYGDSSYVYADSVISLTKYKESLSQPASAHLLKANGYASKGNYTKAFDELALANKYAYKWDNTPLIKHITYLLSRLKTHIGDYNTSNKILIKRLKKINEIDINSKKFPINEATILHNSIQ